MPAPGAREHVSPDGRYRSIAVGERLRIADGQGERFFESALDAAAIIALSENYATWLGPHTVLLRAEEPIALDLETLRTRLVSDDRGASVVTASADGRWVLLRPKGSSASLVASRSER